MTIELNETMTGQYDEFVPVIVDSAGLLGPEGRTPSAFYLHMETPDGRLMVSMPFRYALDLREVIGECIRCYPELLKAK